MDMHKVVHLQPDFFLERMDDEIVVYHPTLTTTLYFNETGALIWQLCDGNRTVAEIIALLTGMYPENAAQIAPEVTTLLAQLLEQQVATLA